MRNENKNKVENIRVNSGGDEHTLWKGNCFSSKVASEWLQWVVILLDYSPLNWGLSWLHWLFPGQPYCFLEPCLCFGPSQPWYFAHDESQEYFSLIEFLLHNIKCSLKITRIASPSSPPTSLTHPTRNNKTSVYFTCLNSILHQFSEKEFYIF